MKFQDPDWQKRQFSCVGNSVAAWCMNAYSLLAGARVLNKKNDLISHIHDDVLPDSSCTLRATFLLYGFALESLLKACYLKIGNKLVIDNKFKPIKGVKMHDLVALAKVAKLRLSQPESDALERLSVQIVSFARYPIGTKPYEERRLSDDYFLSANSFNSRDIGILEEIVKNIEVIVGYDFSNSSLTPIEVQT